MNPKLLAVASRLQHAKQACEANSGKAGELFGAEHPYRICYVRLANKASYSLEIIEFYGRCFHPYEDLSQDQLERVIEAEKWYLIGVLSVIEYSMPSLIGERGTQLLRKLARDGSFSKFLSQALSEGILESDEKAVLEFLSRVRNDLIHRNGVSRESAKLVALDLNRTIELVKDEMVEGYLGMLADLGALALLVLGNLIGAIEDNLVLAANESATD